MSTVYVVTEGSYSDYGIVAIFTSRELAQLFIERYENPGGGKRFNFIEEYELDLFEEQIRAGTKQWTVRMARDGTVIEIQENKPSQEIGSDVFRDRQGVLTLKIVVWADDEQHAIKIANEHRSALTASNRFYEGFTSASVAPITGNEPALSRKGGK